MADMRTTNARMREEFFHYRRLLGTAGYFPVLSLSTRDLRFSRLSHNRRAETIAAKIAKWTREEHSVMIETSRTRFMAMLHDLGDNAFSHYARSALQEVLGDSAIGEHNDAHALVLDFLREQGLALTPKEQKMLDELPLLKAYRGDRSKRLLLSPESRAVLAAHHLVDRIEDVFAALLLGHISIDDPLADAFKEIFGRDSLDDLGDLTTVDHLDNRIIKIATQYMANHPITEDVEFPEDAWKQLADFQTTFIAPKIFPAQRAALHMERIHEEAARVLRSMMDEYGNDPAVVRREFLKLDDLGVLKQANRIREFEGLPEILDWKEYLLKQSGRAIPGDKPVSEMNQGLDRTLFVIQHQVRLDGPMSASKERSMRNAIQNDPRSRRDKAALLRRYIEEKSWYRKSDILKVLKTILGDLEALQDVPEGRFHRVESEITKLIEQETQKARPAMTRPELINLTKRKSRKEKSVKKASPGKKLSSSALREALSRIPEVSKKISAVYLLDYLSINPLTKAPRTRTLLQEIVLELDPEADLTRFEPKVYTDQARGGWIAKKNEPDKEREEKNRQKALEKGRQKALKNKQKLFAKIEALKLDEPLPEGMEPYTRKALIKILKTKPFIAIYEALEKLDLLESPRLYPLIKPVSFRNYESTAPEAPEPTVVLESSPFAVEDTVVSIDNPVLTGTVESIDLDKKLVRIKDSREDINIYSYAGAFERWKLNGEHRSDGARLSKRDKRNDKQKKNQSRASAGKAASEPKSFVRKWMWAASLGAAVFLGYFAYRWVSTPNVRAVGVFVKHENEDDGLRAVDQLNAIIEEYAVSKDIVVVLEAMLPFKKYQESIPEFQAVALDDLLEGRVDADKLRTLKAAFAKAYLEKIPRYAERTRVALPPGDPFHDTLYLSLWPLVDEKIIENAAIEPQFIDPDAAFASLLAGEKFLKYGLPLQSMIQQDPATPFDLELLKASFRAQRDQFVVRDEALAVGLEKFLADNPDKLVVLVRGYNHGPAGVFERHFGRSFRPAYPYRRSEATQELFRNHERWNDAEYFNRPDVEMLIKRWFVEEVFYQVWPDDPQVQDALIEYLQTLSDEQIESLIPDLHSVLPEATRLRLDPLEVLLKHLTEKYPSGTIDAILQATKAYDAKNPAPGGARLSSTLTKDPESIASDSAASSPDSESIVAGFDSIEKRTLARILLSFFSGRELEKRLEDLKKLTLQEVGDNEELSGFERESWYPRTLRYNLFDDHNLIRDYGYYLTHKFKVHDPFNFFGNFLWSMSHWKKRQDLSFKEGEELAQRYLDGEASLVELKVALVKAWALSERARDLVRLGPPENQLSAAYISGMLDTLFQGDKKKAAQFVLTMQDRGWFQKTLSVITDKKYFPSRKEYAFQTMVFLVGASYAGALASIIGFSIWPWILVSAAAVVPSRLFSYYLNIVRPSQNFKKVMRTRPDMFGEDIPQFTGIKRSGARMASLVIRGHAYTLSSLEKPSAVTYNTALLKDIAQDILRVYSAGMTDLGQMADALKANLDHIETNLALIESGVDLVKATADLSVVIYPESRKWSEAERVAFSNLIYLVRKKIDEVSGEGLVHFVRNASVSTPDSQIPGSSKVQGVRLTGVAPAGRPQRLRVGNLEELIRAAQRMHKKHPIGMVSVFPQGPSQEGTGWIYAGRPKRAWRRVISEWWSGRLLSENERFARFLTDIVLRSKQPFPLDMELARFENRNDLRLVPRAAGARLSAESGVSKATSTFTFPGRLNPLFEKVVVPALLQKMRKPDFKGPLKVVYFGIGENGAPTLYDLAGILAAGLKAHPGRVELYGVDGDPTVTRDARVHPLLKNEVRDKVALTVLDGNFERVPVTGADMLIAANVFSHYNESEKKRGFLSLRNYLKPDGILLEAQGSVSDDEDYNAGIDSWLYSHERAWVPYYNYLAPPEQKGWHAGARLSEFLKDFFTKRFASPLDALLRIGTAGWTISAFFALKSIFYGMPGIFGAAHFLGSLLMAGLTGHLSYWDLRANRFFGPGNEILDPHNILIEDKQKILDWVRRTRFAVQDISKLSSGYGPAADREEPVFAYRLALGLWNSVSESLVDLGLSNPVIQWHIFYLMKKALTGRNFASPDAQVTSDQILEKLPEFLDRIETSLRSEVRASGARLSSQSSGKGLSPEEDARNRRIWKNPNPERNSALSQKEFEAAHRTLQGVVRKTPLIYARELSKLSGKDVYVKDESQQVAGSFKIRGVYYEVFKTIEQIIDDYEQGTSGLPADLQIVTQSTGNHAIAMIHSVRLTIDHFSSRYRNRPDILNFLHSIEPVVFTLSNIPRVKSTDMAKALQEYRDDMEIRELERPAAGKSKEKGRIEGSYFSYEAALEARTKFMQSHAGSARYMDHGGKLIMAGHGSAGIEIDEQLRELGIGENKKVALLVPVGAGGPIGIASALKAMRSKKRDRTKAVLVQSDSWDAFVRTLITGQRQKNAPSALWSIFPDGIAVDGPEDEAIRMAGSDMDSAVSVSERGAYYRAGPILFSDLIEASDHPESVRVGGTTALTAEALLGFGDLPEIKDADVVVLFATEGNVPKTVTDHMRRHFEDHKQPHAWQSRGHVARRGLLLLLITSLVGFILATTFYPLRPPAKILELREQAGLVLNEELGPTAEQPLTLQSASGREIGKMWFSEPSERIQKVSKAHGKEAAFSIYAKMGEEPAKEMYSFSQPAGERIVRKYFSPVRRGDQVIYYKMRSFDSKGRLMDEIDLQIIDAFKQSGVLNRPLVMDGQKRMDSGFWVDFGTKHLMRPDLAVGKVELEKPLPPAEWEKNLWLFDKQIQKKSRGYKYVLSAKTEHLNIYLSIYEVTRKDRSKIFRLFVGDADLNGQTLYEYDLFKVPVSANKLALVTQNGNAVVMEKKDKTQTAILNGFPLIVGKPDGARLSADWRSEGRASSYDDLIGEDKRAVLASVMSELKTIEGSGKFTENWADFDGRMRYFIRGAASAHHWKRLLEDTGDGGIDRSDRLRKAAAEWAGQALEPILIQYGWMNFENAANNLTHRELEIVWKAVRRKAEESGAQIPPSEQNRIRGARLADVVDQRDVIRLEEGESVIFSLSKTSDVRFGVYLKEGKHYLFRPDLYSSVFSHFEIKDNVFIEPTRHAGMIETLTQLSVSIDYETYPFFDDPVTDDEDWFHLKIIDGNLVVAASDFVYSEVFSAEPLDSYLWKQIKFGGAKQVSHLPIHFRKDSPRRYRLETWKLNEPTAAHAGKPYFMLLSNVNDIGDYRQNTLFQSGGALLFESPQAALDSAFDEPAGARLAQAGAEIETESAEEARAARKEKERELIARFQDHDDLSAMEELKRRHRGFLMKQAWAAFRRNNQKIPFQDFEDAVYDGFYDALARFTLGKNTLFITYLTHWTMSAIQTLEEQNGIIRIQKADFFSRRWLIHYYTQVVKDMETDGFRYPNEVILAEIKELLGKNPRIDKATREKRIKFLDKLNFDLFSEAYEANLANQRAVRPSQVSGDEEYDLFAHVGREDRFFKNESTDAAALMPFTDKERLVMGELLKPEHDYSSLTESAKKKLRQNTAEAIGLSGEEVDQAEAEALVKLPAALRHLADIGELKDLNAATPDFIRDVVLRNTHIRTLEMKILGIVEMDEEGALQAEAGIDAQSRRWIAEYVRQFRMEYPGGYRTFRRFLTLRHFLTLQAILKNPDESVPSFASRIHVSKQMAQIYVMEIASLLAIWAKSTHEEGVYERLVWGAALALDVKPLAIIRWLKRNNILAWQEMSRLRSSDSEIYRHSPFHDRTRAAAFFRQKLDLSTRQAVASLLTKPLGFDWEGNKAALPSLGGLSLGKTNSAGKISLFPYPNYRYGWSAPGVVQGGWKTRIIKSGVSQGIYELTVEFSKDGKDTFSRTFQIDPHRAGHANGYKKFLGKRKAILRLAPDAAEHALKALIVKPQDFARKLAQPGLARSLTGLRFEPTKGRGELYLFPKPGYLYNLRLLGKEEADWNSRILEARVKSGLLELKIRFEKEKKNPEEEAAEPIERTFEIGRYTKKLKHVTDAAQPDLEVMMIDKARAVSSRADVPGAGPVLKTAELAEDRTKRRDLEISLLDQQVERKVKINRHTLWELVKQTPGFEDVTVRQVYIDAEKIRHEMLEIRASKTTSRAETKKRREAEKTILDELQEKDLTPINAVELHRQFTARYEIYAEVPYDTVLNDIKLSDLKNHPYLRKGERTKAILRLPKEQKSKEERTDEALSAGARLADADAVVQVPFDLKALARDYALYGDRVRVDMNTLPDGPLKAALQWIREHGLSDTLMPMGGVVRDSLLGYQPSDVDFMARVNGNNPRKNRRNASDIFNTLLPKRNIFFKGLGRLYVQQGDKRYRVDRSRSYAVGKEMIDESPFLIFSTDQIGIDADGRIFMPEGQNGLSDLVNGELKFGKTTYFNRKAGIGPKTIIRAYRHKHKYGFLIPPTLYQELRQALKTMHWRRFSPEIIRAWLRNAQSEVPDYAAYLKDLREIGFFQDPRMAGLDSEKKDSGARLAKREHPGQNLIGRIRSRQPVSLQEFFNYLVWNVYEERDAQKLQIVPGRFASAMLRGHSVSDLQDALADMISNALDHSSDASRVTVRVTGGRAGRVNFYVRNRGAIDWMTLRDQALQLARDKELFFTDSGIVSKRALHFSDGVRNFSGFKSVPVRHIRSLSHQDLLFIRGLSVGKSTNSFGGRGEGLFHVRETAKKMGVVFDIREDLKKSTVVTALKGVPIASSPWRGGARLAAQEAGRSDSSRPRSILQMIRDDYEPISVRVEKLDDGEKRTGEFVPAVIRLRTEEEFARLPEPFKGLQTIKDHSPRNVHLLIEVQSGPSQKEIAGVMEIAVSPSWGRVEIQLLATRQNDRKVSRYRGTGTALVATAAKISRDLFGKSARVEVQANRINILNSEHPAGFYESLGMQHLLRGFGIYGGGIDWIDPFLERVKGEYKFDADKVDTLGARSADGGVQIVGGYDERLKSFEKLPAQHTGIDTDEHDFGFTYWLPGLINLARQHTKPSVLEKIKTGRLLLMGPGYSTREILKLLEHFPEADVHVVDPVYDNLEHIRSELNDDPRADKKKIKLYHAAFDAMPFKDGEFDAIFSSRVIDKSLRAGEASLNRWAGESKRVLNRQGLYFAFSSDLQPFFSNGFYVLQKDLSDPVWLRMHFLAYQTPDVLEAPSDEGRNESQNEGRNVQGVRLTESQVSEAQIHKSFLFKVWDSNHWILGNEPVSLPLMIEKGKLLIIRIWQDEGETDTIRYQVDGRGLESLSIEQARQSYETLDKAAALYVDEALRYAQTEKADLLQAVQAVDSFAGRIELVERMRELYSSDLPEAETLAHLQLHLGARLALAKARPGKVKSFLDLEGFRQTPRVQEFIRTTVQRNPGVLELGAPTAPSGPDAVLVNVYGNENGNRKGFLNLRLAKASKFALPRWSQLIVAAMMILTTLNISSTDKESRMDSFLNVSSITAQDTQSIQAKFFHSDAHLDAAHLIHQVHGAEVFSETQVLAYQLLSVGRILETLRMIVSAVQAAA